MENNYNNREEMVEEYIKKGEYEKAFKALVLMIELINIKIIKNRIDNKFKSDNFYEIMEIYRKKDEELYKIIKNINYIYEMYSNNKMNNDSIIELKDLYNQLKLKQ